MTRHEFTSPDQTREIWPRIKLNILTVERIAKWGFGPENPFRDSDLESVIGACCAYKGVMVPCPALDDASTRLIQKIRRELDLTLSRVLAGELR